MTKLSKNSIPSEDLENYINNLWSAFTLARSKEDIRLLFKDLFTHTEYKMFAKRFEIARRLLKKDTYEQIANDLKVTPVTISKISNTLAETGDGLRKAVENVNQLEEELFKKEQSRLRDLENPLRKALRNKFKSTSTTLLVAGAQIVDKKLLDSDKRKSAKKKLNV